MSKNIIFQICFLNTLSFDCHGKHINNYKKIGYKNIIIKTSHSAKSKSKHKLLIIRQFYFTKKVMYTGLCLKNTLYLNIKKKILISYSVLKHLCNGNRKERRYYKHFHIVSDLDQREII